MSLDIPAYEKIRDDEIYVGMMVVRTGIRSGRLGKISVPGSVGKIVKIRSGQYGSISIIWDDDNNRNPEDWDISWVGEGVLGKLIEENSVDDWADLLEIEA